MPVPEPPEQLVALARVTAKEHGLEDSLVCGIVEQESSWDPWTIRYEPMFQARYVKPLDLDPTSTVARSMSWGLMQVMGQSAREIGYAAQLPKLCDPETGLAWGCALLAEKLRRASGDPQKALLLWNGGSNPNYPAEVLAKAQAYKV